MIYMRDGTALDDCVQEIVKLLRNSPLKPNVRVVRGKKQLMRSSEKVSPDIIVSAGGDGTLLDVVSFAVGRGVPVLGINLGKIGFLTSLDMSAVEKQLIDMLMGEHILEERKVLEVYSVDEPDNKMVALNECTIQKYGGASMIGVEVFIDGERAGFFRGDGIMLATPSGSTAYSLSCGGPILMPNVNALILTFIAPHSLTARPIVIPDTSTVEFIVQHNPKGKAYITVDANQWIISSSLHLKSKISDKKIIFMRPVNYSPLNRIKEKLGWAP